MKEKQPFLRRLQERWNLRSLTDVWIVLLVFALTGTTIVLIKRPVIHFLAGENPSWIFQAAYYILILPIYNIVLLGYGAVFGRFSFFWEFEKKMFRRMSGKRENNKARD